MAFRKIRSAPEEDDKNPFYRPGNEPSKSGKTFIVSNKAFKWSTVASAGTTSFILPIFFALRIYIKLKVSDADIQALSQITAALSAFMIAVPLFLKDVYRGSNFWKQFFLIAVTFTLSTVVGVSAFLTVSADLAVNLSIWLAGAIYLSISFNFLFTIRISKIQTNSGLGFFLSLLPLVLGSISVAENRLVNFFILISFFGFYLMITLIGSVLIQLFIFDKAILNTMLTDNNTRIKLAIKELAETYKQEALTERNLIYKLKTEKFREEPEIVSLTKVQLLVSEMDADTDSANPLVTIYELDYDKIIPRWNKTLQNLVEQKCSRFIVLLHSSAASYWFSDADQVSRHEQIAKAIYGAMTKMTGLSSELLRENISWTDKYQYFGFGIWLRTRSSFDITYALLFAHKDVIQDAIDFFPTLDSGDSLTDEQRAEINRLEITGELIFERTTN